MRLTIVAAVAAVTVWSAFAGRAAAFDDFAGTRPTGMGGASRAWAIGDAGPLLNPSGMALVKTYTVEPTYQYASREDAHFFHTSVVDNTSSYALAGGLYYTYHTAQYNGIPSGHGHEAGLALAIPFAEYVAIGATIKYFNLTEGDTYTYIQSRSDGGITFDLGATVRPIPNLSFAVVGTNLRSLGTSHAAQTIGYGAAYLPIPSLVLAADGVTSFTVDNETARKGTSAMGGAEWIIGGRFGLRAGGGYDDASGNGYVSGGLSLISEVAALDAGLRHDVTEHGINAGPGSGRQTLVGVTLRIFVPAEQTQPQ